MYGTRAVPTTHTDIAPAAPRPTPGLPDEMQGRAAAAADFLKALSHEGRLLILCHLVGGEKTVSELEDLLGVRQAAVSQNLARLRADRMVHARRDGRTIHYSLADPKVARTVTLLYEMFCAKPDADTES